MIGPSSKGGVAVVIIILTEIVVQPSSIDGAKVLFVGDGDSGLLYALLSVDIMIVPSSNDFVFEIYETDSRLLVLTSLHNAPWSFTFS